jgi:hypothetical protein
MFTGFNTLTTSTLHPTNLNKNHSLKSDKASGITFAANDQFESTKSAAAPTKGQPGKNLLARQKARLEEDKQESKMALKEYQIAAKEYAEAVKEHEIAVRESKGRQRVQSTQSKVDTERLKVEAAKNRYLGIQAGIKMQKDILGVK